MKTEKIPSTIVYLPEFIRSLKGGFKDGSFESKLQRVREANILMLDDIGAEEITPWARDEVIGRSYIIEWFKNCQLSSVQI